MKALFINNILGYVVMANTNMIFVEVSVQFFFSFTYINDTLFYNKKNDCMVIQSPTETPVAKLEDKHGSLF
jgi:hypothetical protein